MKKEPKSGNRELSLVLGLLTDIGWESVGFFGIGSFMRLPRLTLRRASPAQIGRDCTAE